MRGNGFRVGSLLVALTSWVGVVFAPGHAAVAANLAPTETAAYRVKDINTAEQPMAGVCGSGFSNMGELADGTLMLGLRTNDTGCELWRSDGTITGTQMVRDIHPGIGDSLSVGTSLVVGNRMLFAANDGALGSELWSSDGTITGTQLVMDICPGTCSHAIYRLMPVLGGTLMMIRRSDNSDYEMWVTDGSANGTQPLNATYKSINDSVLYQNKFYFACSDSDFDNYELCVSDGTVAGTKLLADIRPGPDGSNPHYFVALPNYLFFVARDDVHGQEPWVTDGNAVGIVADIYPNAVASTPDNVSVVTNFAGTPTAVIFAATDDTHGRELWRTDGTVGGTNIISDVVPGSVGSNPLRMGADSVSAFYSVANTALGREPVVVSFGGAIMVRIGDINAGPNSSDPGIAYSAGSTIYFIANDGVNGRELWKTSIGASQAQLVKDLVPGPNGLTLSSAIAYQSQLFFVASTDQFGYELFKSDGTDANTSIVSDIRPGSADSGPRGLFVYGDQLYFNANDGTHGEELWHTDGSFQKTGMLINTGVDVGSANFLGPWAAFASGDVGFEACENFGASNQVCSLWASDGTPTQTQILKTGLAPNLYQVARTGEAILFEGQTDNDIEPWRSDGTAAGTEMLRDIYPGSISQPYAFQTIGDAAYFYARYKSGNTDVTDVWRSDGTLTGTQPISTDVNLFGVVSGDGYLYSDGVNLYRSDLALIHTQTLKALPASSFSDFVQFEKGGAGQVFFLQLRRQLSAQNRPTDLWVSDGTPEGTRFVKTVSNFERSAFNYQMRYANGLLYFVANPDGAGDELWRSDGTEAGTTRVRDIFPGAGSASPSELTALNGKIYFGATDADSRRLLYVSDGSEIGTKPMRSGVDAPIEPTNLYATEGQLYFSAADAAHGRELWHSDGTVANTGLLQDIALGTLSSNPASFVRAGNHLFFAATTVNEGQEMWAIAFPIQTYLPRLMR